MRRLTALLALLILVAATPAHAFVSQTINVDGVNDFDPSNLLKDDRNDTQAGCVPSALPMDLGRVYVTNDANFLYIGIEFAKTCYCDMNLGMALDIGTAGGGITDPFGRKIGWSGVPFKPDYVIYDVTPTNCNTFNYEILYKDTLVAGVDSWQNRSTLINPSWGSGANGLGIVDSVNFKELKIPLSVLGVTTGTNMHLEFWTTQEGTTKGPLDALSSDNVQMSHFASTTYDTTAVVQMTSMLTYTILNAVDLAPPTVVNAQAVGFAVLASKQFGLLSNKIDVQFSEPVELASSQVTGNYAFSGPVVRSVIGAIRDASVPSLVHLTLNSAISANAAPYLITVTGVKDIVGNTTAANGTTNVGAFFLQNITFNGDFHLGLCSHAFATTDTFAVEGSVNPLSFALCDNAFMTDANSDSIYTVTVPFCLIRDRITLKGEADLEWKFTRNCNQYEPLSGNRTYHLSSDNGATVTISAPWNNDDPSNYTSRAVDVVFTVNATRRNPIPSDVITLLGDAGPLAFTQPGVVMHDNGVAPDAVAGDKIYTARVTFPACTKKSVGWKVDFNGTIECTGQGDRSVFLNDAIFSSANPIVLPARGIDRCQVTDKAITVLFRLDMDVFDPLPNAPTDSIAVMGDQLPLRFDYPPAAALLKNNGVFPDAAANDVFFGRAVTFPDSTPFTLSYKYWKNGVFECASLGNRTLTLDDFNFSTGTPQTSLGSRWDFCSDATGVPVSTLGKGGDVFAALMPVMPNPVSRRASFAFELHRSGRVALRVYDVSGRRVANLLDAALSPGLHTVAWDGRGDNGARLESGVYLYELAMGGQRVSRRLILTH